MRRKSRGHPESVFLPKIVLPSGDRQPPDTENFRRIALQTSGFFRDQRIAGEKKYRKQKLQVSAYERDLHKKKKKFRIRGLTGAENTQWIADDIEFYNSIRPHRELHSLSPDDFERNFEFNEIQESGTNI